MVFEAKGAVQVVQVCSLLCCDFCRVRCGPNEVFSAVISTESKSHRTGRLRQSVSPCLRTQVVGGLAVVCIDVEAQEIVAVFVFELYRFLVEVQRGKLLYVGVALKFFLVNDDGAVVHVSANPQLICKVSAADELSVHT